MSPLRFVVVARIGIAAAALGVAAPAVRAALRKAYQSLDWAAIKRIVDRPW